VTYKKIKVSYFNNKLSIDEVNNKDSKIISHRWTELREDYSDWVSDVRFKTFDMGIPLIELFEWKDMSTWWLNPLTTKDIDIDNRWIHQLMVLYLFKCFPNKIEFITDDNLLLKSIHSNFKNESGIQYKKLKSRGFKGYVKLNYRKLYNYILILFSFFKIIKKWIILLKFRDKQINHFKSLKPSVWFRTIYPASWVMSNNGTWHDRHYTDAPINDNENGQVARYLIYIGQYGKNFSFFKLWNELNNIEQKTSRESVFPEAHLSLKDIFQSYISTFNEWKFFKKIRPNKSFTDLFKIKDLDLSDILLDEWESSYFGEMQLYKLNGLSLGNFLHEIKNPQIIATYGEFFSQVRAEYHLSNLTSPNSKFVAIQHAMNVKSKMFTYYRKDEISQKNAKNHINFLPVTDIFLVQGRQYSDILSEFYPSENIEIIGCLKYDSYSKSINVGKYTDKNLDKKTILIAPSVNDYQSILDVFSAWQENNNWRVILSPHPATKVKNIEHYQRKKYPNLKIHYNTISRTSELMKEASLIITGQSTMAVEANFHNIKAIRFINLGSFPMFDYEEMIPVFYNSASFVEWFKFQDWENQAVEIKNAQASIISRYFYKVDGLASQRMWASLNNLDLIQ
jgi:hypothetical protein